MSLTKLDLELMNTAVETAAKQGFKMLTISEYGINDSREYRLFCQYGESEEVYFVYVNPWHERVTKVKEIAPQSRDTEEKHRATWSADVKANLGL